MSALKWLAGLVGVAIAMVALAIGLMALRPASTRAIDGPDAIAALERVSLGGVEQTLLVRGQDRAAPVLLYLHGGPGFAHLPMAPGYSDELEKHFVVVHWDQRGAGASCEGTDWNELHLDRVVADAIELSEHLASRFGGEGRIVLLGHSWGSVVGVRAVQARPDLFHAYVGLGQLVNGPQNEQVSYEWVVREAERRGDEEALADLRTVSPPYGDFEELGVQRTWLMTYGGSFYAEDRFASLIAPLLFGPEYTLATRLSFPGCMNQSIDALWGELGEIDFPSQTPRLEVPVFFFTGRHDWNTPHPLVEAWAETLEAPHVEMVWFEGAGHMVPMEVPDEFQRELIDRLRPLALESTR